MRMSDAQSGLSRGYLSGFLLGGGLAWLVVDALLIEPNSLKFERIDIQIPSLPDAFDGYRIALFADLHYPRLEGALIQRAIEMANAFKPDLVAIPGDLCDKYRSQPPSAPVLAGMFDGLEARDGIVATLGNHDHWLDIEGIRRELAERTPVRLIDNRAILIERDGHRMAVGGVGDLEQGVVDAHQAFASIPDGIPRLLLSHNPDVAETIDPALHIDLMLSGHTHGGQINLPLLRSFWIGSEYGDKYRAGLVQGRGCQVYITRGLYTARHLRFRCRPEVTGITLRRG